MCFATLGFQGSGGGVEGPVRVAVTLSGKGVSVLWLSAAYIGQEWEEG